MWSIGIDAHEYAGFLQRLLNDIATTDDNGATYFWRREEETQFGGYVDHDADGGGAGDGDDGRGDHGSDREGGGEGGGKGGGEGYDGDMGASAAAGGEGGRKGHTTSKPPHAKKKPHRVKLNSKASGTQLPPLSNHKKKPHRLEGAARKHQLISSALPGLSARHKSHAHEVAAPEKKKSVAQSASAAALLPSYGEALEAQASRRRPDAIWMPTGVRRGCAP